MEYPIENLMLIDDDRVDQLLYKRMFDRSGKVKNLIQMEAGDVALKHLRTAECPEIDAILLDIRMPRMDGFDFLDALSADVELKPVRAVIVMLTTSLAACDQERATSHPLVADFWHKPLEEWHISKLCRLLESKGHTKG